MKAKGPARPLGGSGLTRSGSASQRSQPYLRGSSWPLRSGGGGWGVSSLLWWGARIQRAWGLGRALNFPGCTPRVCSAVSSPGLFNPWRPKCRSQSSTVVCLGRLSGCRSDTEPLIHPLSSKDQTLVVPVDSGVRQQGYALHRDNFGPQHTSNSYHLQQRFSEPASLPVQIPVVTYRGLISK